MEADDWVPEWEMDEWEPVYYDEFGDEVHDDYMTDFLEDEAEWATYEAEWQKEWEAELAAEQAKAVDDPFYYFEEPWGECPKNKAGEDCNGIKNGECKVDPFFNEWYCECKDGLTGACDISVKKQEENLKVKTTVVTTLLNKGKKEGNYGDAKANTDMMKSILTTDYYDENGDVKGGAVNDLNEDLLNGLTEFFENSIMAMLGEINGYFDEIEAAVTDAEAAAPKFDAENLKKAPKKDLAAAKTKKSAKLTVNEDMI